MRLNERGEFSHSLRIVINAYVGMTTESVVRKITNRDDAPTLQTVEG
jgi:hypothetical protein